MSPRGSKLPIPGGKAFKKLSTLLRAKLQPPNHGSLAPISDSSPFNAIPVDIVEEILLHLPGQDILRMKQVSRGFADLISTSPFLEYRLELFAAGLVENPHFSCSPEEGRKRVKEYVDTWDDLYAVKRHIYPLGLSDFRWEDMAPVGWGIFAGLSGHSVAFVRVPCTAAGQQGVEEWTVDIPPAPFQPCTFAVYPPEDVLALVECRYPVIRIRILNAKDGSPHHLPLEHVILWDTGFRGGGMRVQCAKMTASRLMIIVAIINISIVWDWRTGRVVLKWTSTGTDYLGFQPSVSVFLDEFRLLTAGQTTVGGCGVDLIMFDTSLPQQSSDSWRRLEIGRMPNYRHLRYPRAWEVQIHTDCDTLQGGGSRDGPFFRDATQSVVVVALYHRDRWHPSGVEPVFVIQAAALVKHMSSTRSGEHKHWDDWKRDVIVVEVPRYGASYLPTFVHGARVLFVTYNWQGRQYRFQTYDFSRWGCRTFVRAGDGEKERTVVYNPEKGWSPTPNIELGSMRTSGNSLVMCENTAFPSDIYVWELT